MKKIDTVQFDSTYFGSYVSTKYTGIQYSHDWQTILSTGSEIYKYWSASGRAVERGPELYKACENASCIQETVCRAQERNDF
jgi:hypothetical protein